MFCNMGTFPIAWLTASWSSLSALISTGSAGFVPDGYLRFLSLIISLVEIVILPLSGLTETCEQIRQRESRLQPSSPSWILVCSVECRLCHHDYGWSEKWKAAAQFLINLCEPVVSHNANSWPEVHHGLKLHRWHLGFTHRPLKALVASTISSDGASIKADQINRKAAVLFESTDH